MDRCIIYPLWIHCWSLVNVSNTKKKKSTIQWEMKGKQNKLRHNTVEDILTLVEQIQQMVSWYLNSWCEHPLWLKALNPYQWKKKKKKTIKLNRHNNLLEYHFPQKHKLEGTRLTLCNFNITAYVWLPLIHEFNR